MTLFLIPFVFSVVLGFLYSLSLISPLATKHTLTHFETIISFTKCLGATNISAKKAKVHCKEMSDPLFQPVQVKEESEPVHVKEEFDPVHVMEEFDPVHVKEELPNYDENPFDPMHSTCMSNEENSQLPPESSTGAAEVDDIGYWTLTGTKPYFDLILTKSNVTRPYQVNIPTKFIRELPSALVPVVLTSRGKRWKTWYHGDKVAKRLDSSWKSFATDNDLKIGDCCFFELMECSKTKIEFKVIILRGEPAVDGEADGDTPETAIFIE